MINLYESELKQIYPNDLKKDLKAQAFGFAFDNQIKKIIECCSKLVIWSDLKNIDVSLLDYMANELRTQYYDGDLDESIKRQLVSNTLLWYKKAGTVRAVEELITTVMGSGEVKDWHQYDGQPHHYKVRTPNITITEDDIRWFNDMIQRIKRKTAVLDAIEITLESSIDDIYGFTMHTGDFITIKQEVEG